MSNHKEMNRRTFVSAILGSVFTPVVAQDKSIDPKVCHGSKTGKDCRYFGVSDKTGIPCCLKLSPVHRQIVDEQVAIYFQERVSIPLIPLDDNCSGCYPSLEALSEGI